jgi:hypothetical protein
LSVLISCAQDPDGSSQTDGGDAAGTSDTAAPEDTTAADTAYVWNGAIQPGDYGGYTFTILNGCTASWYSRNAVTAEDMTGEPINDAVFERNSRVSEYLNVEIAEVSTTDAVGDTRKDVAADTGAYDISLISLMNVVAPTLEGLLLQYENVPNINLDAPYWDQNAVADMSIGGKHWYCISDFDTTRFDGIRSLYFNKQMIKDNSLENPYELVDSNKWTIDKFLEMCAAVVSDTDGDGAYTDADRYGIVSYDEIMVDLLMYASGIKYIRKDANDMLELYAADDKFYDVYEKIRSLMFDDNMAFDVRASSKAKYLRGLGDRMQEQMFLENKALFYSECMAWTRVLREMEADFGVLPPPKYDENQSRYYSVIINPFTTAIPVTSKDAARTGHIVDALAAASHDTVVPAYVDITLSGKVARDPDTVRMLELVFAELAYNIHISTVTLRSTIFSTIQSNSTAIASMLEKSSKAFTKSISKTNESFTELIAGN